MVFEDYKVDGDSITLTKKELEDIRDHYLKVADKFKPKPQKGCRNPLLYGMYIGKADLCIDMLKMFEPLEGL